MRIDLVSVSVARADNYVTSHGAACDGITDDAAALNAYLATGAKAEFPANRMCLVASNNLKAAAENEGQALLITKTKAAEAEGNAIKISAGAEREAARLRGQGVALFRQEVAHGMSEAAEEMKNANLDTNVILFSMWTEAIKNFAEVGKGNIIFLDGSSQGMENTMRQIQSLMVKASGTN